VRGHLVIPNIERKQASHEEKVQEESAINQVKVSQTLTPAQKKRVKELLEEFSDVFKTKASIATRTDAAMHRIRLKEGSKPHFATPHHHAPKVLKDLKDLLDKLLAEGMISPGEGPWAAPVVMVRKPCGSWRMCIDFRKLNEQTEKDKFPLPRIQDLHHSLRGSSWFSTMDAMSGFHQIILDPRDRKKTGFITKFGLFEWNVMPMGLANAPSSFQRFMTRVLTNEGGLHRFSLVYVDDIIVHSRTFEAHLEHLRRVFVRLRHHSVTLKAKKCAIGFRRLKFLGFVADGEGIRPDPEKVAAIQKFEAPTTLKRVQRFLGAANWLRDTVKNFALIADPLYQLQKGHSNTKRKRIKLDWRPEHQRAFEAVKAAVAEATMLRHPDFNKEFHVDVDASDVGIGAVLQQKDEEGRMRPILFASKALSAEQRKWKTAEKEAFASIWALKEKLRPFLVGQKFKLHTDHANLRFVLRQKKGKLARWGLILSEFLDDMTIVHKPGKDNVIADALSRDAVGSVPGDEDDAEPTIHSLAAISVDTLRAAQLADPRWGDVIRFIEDQKLPEDDRLKDKVRRTAETCMVDSAGILRHTEAPSFKFHGAPEPPVCVPASKVEAVLREVHGKTHAGARRTHFDVTRRFFWPKMRSQIVKHVRNCIECQKSKATRSHRRSTVTPIFFTKPWDVVGLDLFGPLPKTTSGNKHVLTVIDTFTRFVQFIPLKVADADEVVRAINDRIIPIFGVPKRFHTDNGTQFTSTMFQHVCERLNVKHTKTLPWHPQGNGATERVHRLLKSRLRIHLKTAGKQWDDWVGPIALAHNQGLLATTNFTPFQLTFGRQPNLFPSDLKNNVAGQSMDLQLFGKDLVSIMQESWRQAKEDFKWAKEKMAKNANAPMKPRTKPTFKVDDIVLLHRHVRSDAKAKLSSKLRFEWVGPFKVVSHLGNNGFELQTLSRPHRLERAHADNLSPFRPSLEAHRAAHEVQPAEPGGALRANEVILVQTPQGPHFAKVTVPPDDDERTVHVHWMNSTSRRSLPLHKRVWRLSHVDPTDNKCIVSNRPPVRCTPELGMVEKEDVLLRDVLLTARGLPDAETTRRLNRLRV